MGNPRYIVDLVKRVTTVSVKTREIVGLLPALPDRTAAGNGSESRGSK